MKFWCFAGENSMRDMFCLICFVLNEIYTIIYMNWWFTTLLVDLGFGILDEFHSYASSTLIFKPIICLLLSPLDEFAILLWNYHLFHDFVIDSFLFFFFSLYFYSIINPCANYYIYICNNNILPKLDLFFVCDC